METRAFANCLQLLPKLPPTVDPTTITVSNNPGNKGEKRKVADVAGVPISQTGLGYVILDDSMSCRPKLTPVATATWSF